MAGASCVSLPLLSLLLLFVIWNSLLPSTFVASSDGFVKYPSVPPRNSNWSYPYVVNYLRMFVLISVFLFYSIVCFVYLYLISWDLTTFVSLFWHYWVLIPLPSGRSQERNNRSTQIRNEKNKIALLEISPSAADSWPWRMVSYHYSAAVYICSPNCNLLKKWSPSVLGRIFHSMLMHCLRVQSYLSFLLFLFACLQFVWFLLFILFFSQYFTINSFFSKLPDEQSFLTLTSLQKQARPLIGVRPYIERTLVKLGVYLMKTS